MAMGAVPAVAGALSVSANGRTRSGPSMGVRAGRSAQVGKTGRDRAFRALAPGCSIRSKHTQMAGLTTTARASSCQSCPVFLAWMARGSLDYQKQSLGVPDAVQEAKEANREDMDLLKGSSAA